jgi:hypothetical protein
MPPRERPSSVYWMKLTHLGESCPSCLSEDVGCDAPDVGGRTYRLIVAGELSDDLASALGGTTLECADGTTTWTVFVRDQAELQGILHRVADLGLTLLTATAVDDVSRGPGSGVSAGPDATRSIEGEARR